MRELRTRELRRGAAMDDFSGRSGRSSVARLIPAGLAALIFGLVCGTARANTITVYSLIDPGAAGTCSLRDAITAANTKKAVHSCAKGNGTDTIVFNNGLSGTITLSSTLPAIVNTLTIQGTATSPPAITISGGSLVQLVVVNSGANVNLSYLTLIDGYCDSLTCNGGAIVNNGTLKIGNSTLSDNSSNAPNGAANGGAIDNGGSLTVANSTLSGNTALRGDGGGIENSSGTATVINSTFYDNSATVGGGGGIYARTGAVTVVNSTFADNSATLGGAISSDSLAVINLEGTILASSTGGNCEAAITDEGYNLYDDNTCPTSSGTSEQVTDADLNLGTLGTNGGPTETVALNSPSTAIGFIPTLDCVYQNINPCTNPPTSSASGPLVCDQRGVTRPQQTAGCDAGAFELQETTEFTLDTGLIVFPLQFAAGGSITLATNAPTFNPVTQPVTITISSPSVDIVPTFGPLGVTIAPGSFKLVGNEYKYSGTIGGIKYGVTIGVPNANGISEFTFFVFGVDVAGITNDVTVTLQVGPNIGTDDVDAAIL
jgi:predicted outer membrane repeat protein